MSDMSIAIICLTIILWILARTFCNVKKISANLYSSFVKDEENKSLPKSPYGITRTRNYKNENGYSITKHGEVLKIHGTDNTYEVFAYLSSAISQINQYEKIEGYRLTKVD